jgi:hypothetical protein
LTVGYISLQITGFKNPIASVNVNVDLIIFEVFTLTIV